MGGCGSALLCPPKCFRVQGFQGLGFRVLTNLANDLWHAGSTVEPYKDVKRATDSFLGIPSQCFQPSKAGIGRGASERAISGRVQYCANVVLAYFLAQRWS